MNPRNRSVPAALAGTPAIGSIVVNGTTDRMSLKGQDARGRNESVSMQQIATRFPEAWVTEDRHAAKPKLALVNLPLAPALQGGYLLPKFPNKTGFQESLPWPASPSKTASTRFPTDSISCSWRVIGRA